MSAAKANNVGLKVIAVCDNVIFTTTETQSLVLNALTGKIIATSSSLTGENAV